MVLGVLYVNFETFFLTEYRKSVIFCLALILLLHNPWQCATQQNVRVQAESPRCKQNCQNLKNETQQSEPKSEYKRNQARSIATAYSKIRGPRMAELLHLCSSGKKPMGSNKLFMYPS